MHLSIARHQAGPADVVLSCPDQGLYGIFSSHGPTGTRSAEEVAEVVRYACQDDTPAGWHRIQEHLRLELPRVVAAVAKLGPMREWFVPAYVVVTGGSRCYSRRLSGRMRRLPPTPPLHHRPRPDSRIHSLEFNLLADELLLLAGPPAGRGLDRRDFKQLIHGHRAAPAILAAVLRHHTTTPPPSLIVLAG